jgi:hypothetical protein
MRPEYDIRGGVRGKYFEQYTASIAITFEGSRFVANSTASAPPVGRITRQAPYLVLQSGPKIKIGSPVAA